MVTIKTREGLCIQKKGLDYQGLKTLVEKYLSVPGEAGAELYDEFRYTHNLQPAVLSAVQSLPDGHSREP